MIGREEKEECDWIRGKTCRLTLPLDYNCTWHLAHSPFMTNNACMLSNELIYTHIFSISLSLGL